MGLASVKMRLAGLVLTVGIAETREYHMTVQRKVLLGVVGWLATVTLLHLWLNVRAFDWSGGRKEADTEEFRVGFLPVT
jgi:hypothetical protein